MGLFSFWGRKKTRNLSIQQAFGDELIKLVTQNVLVSPSTAANVAAVYACQTAISESIAMLPLTLYDDKGEDRERLYDHPLIKVLRDAPNGFSDPFVFFESMQLSLLDHGNAYAFIEKTRDKRIVSLTPLDATRMRLKVLPGNAIAYHYQPGKGEPEKTYTSDQIFHVKYRSKDGLLGLSPLKSAADTFKFAQSLLQHGNRIFENGAFFSGLLKYPATFNTDEDRAAFLKSFREGIAGVTNSGKIGLLEGGAEYSPHQMNMKDAEYSEIRRASAIDIARIFRMPPHMIQELSGGASFASIEQQSINFVQYTIQPWATRWEQAIRRQLLLSESPHLYVKFNIMALVRGDLKSRTEAIVQQMQYGLLTLNRGRELLDEDKIDDAMADEPLVSHNLRPLSQVGQEPKSIGGDPEDPAAAPAKSAPNETAPAEQTHSRFAPLFEDLERRLIKREDELVKYAVRHSKSAADTVKSLRRHGETMQEMIAPAARCVSEEYVPALESWIGGYIDSRITEIERDGIAARNVECDLSALLRTLTTEAGA